jgi:hypothetical protein
VWISNFINSPPIPSGTTSEGLGGLLVLESLLDFQPDRPSPHTPVSQLCNGYLCPDGPIGLEAFDPHLPAT